jgi:hypothetical protein
LNHQNNLSNEWVEENMNTEIMFVENTLLKMGTAVGFASALF